MPKTIITGQQIGLGGGPLFTLYKVLGVRYLANELDRAIYWLETNDGDIKEISWLSGFDKNGNLFTLKWQKPSMGKRSGAIKIDIHLINLLNDFFDRVEQTKHTAGLRQKVLECYQEGDRLEKASHRFAKFLFQDLSLEYFSPHWQDFRDFSQDFLIREIKKTSEGTQANAFLMEKDIRLALFKKANQVVTRSGRNIDYVNSTLVPNVMMRNVIQDAYFKSDIYVAGPSETAYIKQLDEQYVYHQVTPARVQPRMSTVIVSEDQIKDIKTLNLNLLDLQEKPCSQIQFEYIDKRSCLEVSQLKKKLFKKKEDWIKKLSLGGQKKSFEKILYKEFKHINGAIRSHYKVKYQKELSCIKQLSSWIRPYNQPQERIFNGLQMMNKWGVDFTKIVLSHYDFRNKKLVLP